MIAQRVLRGVKRRLLGALRAADYRAPRSEASSRAGFPLIGSPRIVSANVMYSMVVNCLEPFNVVWCTGVLYRNLEQLWTVRHLYAPLRPHLPPARAGEPRLAMVGFGRLVRSRCHGRLSRALAVASAASLSTQLLASRPALSYALAGDDGYDIGKAL